MRATSSAASGSSIKSSRGPRQQRPADGDPLRLAAREAGRLAVEQGRDAEQRDDAVEFVAVAATAREGRHAPAVAEVAAHRQMREQPRLLEDVADAALVHGHVDAAGCVEQGLAVERDAALRRPDQPGDDVDERRLARTRRPEQRRHPPRRSRTPRRAGRRPGGGGRRPRASCAGADAGGRSAAAALGCGGCAHRRVCPIARRVRRASSSDSTRAASDSATEISVRRSAGPSPPGTWV